MFLLYLSVVLLSFENSLAERCKMQAIESRLQVAKSDYLEHAIRMNFIEVVGLF